MPRTIAHYIESVANVAIVVTCASVVFLAGTQFVQGNKQATASPPQAKTVLAEGDSLTSGIVDPAFLRGTRQTLLLYVKASCRFCAESIPFYERLTHDARLQNQSRARVAVITADSRDITAAFLKNSTLAVLPTFEIRRDAVSNLKLPGTPAAVLVNSFGVVKKVWIGRLDDRTEREVLDALFSDD